MSRVDLQASTYLRKRFRVVQRDSSTGVGSLAGHTVTMTLSLTKDSAALYTFTGTVVDSSASVALCEIELLQADMDTITNGVYWYRINVESTATSYKPLEGVFLKEAA